MIRKADIILGILLIIVGLISTYAVTRDHDTGNMVYVLVDGETYGYYSLLEDRTVEIRKNDNINKITIKDGSVSMDFSDCSNQDCVKHSSISKTSESIVCLPHKVVVEIHGEDAEFDAVSK